MNAIGNWIRTNRIVAFFLLAFAISWPLNGVVIVLGMELGWTRFIIGIFSTSGPAIAAGIVVYVSEDNPREWARGIIKWRVHPKWYAVAIGIPAAIALGTAVAAYFVGAPIVFDEYSPALIALLIGIVLGTLIGGGQEEIGWRGFAQPELQERYGALTAAVGIGVIWGAWHLPLFIAPFDQSELTLVSQVSYFVGITAFSVLLAWVYNGTGGSILLAMIMHGSINASGGVLVPIDVDVVIVNGTTDYVALVPITVSNAVITVLFALVVVVVVGTKLHMERNEGGIDPPQESMRPA